MTIQGEFGPHSPFCPARNESGLCRCEATHQGRHRMQYAGKLDPHQELVKEAMIETARLVEMGAIRTSFAPAGADPFKGKDRPDVVLPAAAFTSDKPILSRTHEDDLARPAHFSRHELEMLKLPNPSPVSQQPLPPADSSAADHSPLAMLYAREPVTVSKKPEPPKRLNWFKRLLRRLGGR